ncbi:hypothetical protein Fuma_01568 [Fuerstiella marisgermanici]|uniref:Uncharacterized protein n=1 Tax=Fuerstiella marisgermanici TaxID=1891926 RepID=A0A1P8WD46_9PLAN|nr:hypothetical protein Fuma_01568 [Fuerstiella marisgermanici]
MTDESERPAFRMSEPPEMLHFDLARDRHRSTMRRISGGCLILAWILIVLSLTLPITGLVSFSEITPLTGTGNRRGILHSLSSLIYVAFLFAFLSTPAAFCVTKSILVGRCYAGMMFAGMSVSLSYPLLLKVSNPAMTGYLGVCWALWCGCFLSASAAFLIPVLYTRYAVDEES